MTKIIASPKITFSVRDVSLFFFPLFYLQESTFPKDYIYKGNYKGFLHEENLISGINTQSSLDYTLVFLMG